MTAGKRERAEGRGDRGESLAPQSGAGTRKIKQQRDELGHRGSVLEEVRADRAKTSVAAALWFQRRTSRANGTRGCRQGLDRIRFGDLRIENARRGTTPMPPADKNYDDNNIFAKILRGEMPCHRVFEDDVALAFMDIMPRITGHALVIPKFPARNLLDADPDGLAELIKRVQTDRPRRQDRIQS